MVNREYATALNTLLANAHLKWDSAPILTSDRNLRAQFVSQLAYALEGKEILYATVEYDESEETIDALVFTANTIVWTNYAKANGELETEVMSKAQLETIAVTGAPNYFASPNDAPGLIRGRATIAGKDFDLPGDGAASSQNYRDLAVFLPRLLP